MIGMSEKTEEQILSEIDSNYRNWFLKVVEREPMYKNPKLREALLQRLVEYEFNDREGIKKSTGYIGVWKVHFNKKMNSFSPPKPVREDVLYLLSKDRITFTRDINEALMIEGSRIAEGSQKIDIIANGYEYEFIQAEHALSMLSHFPPKRKPITKAEREATYAKFDGHCAYCGCEIAYGEMEVDHFVSHMSNFGEDTLDNYMPACHDCNHVKVDYTIEQFRRAVAHCGEIHRARKKPIMAISDRIAIKYGLTEGDRPIEFYYERSKGNA